jgi:hypothetical protein
MIHHRKEIGIADCGQFNSFSIELQFTDDWEQVDCKECRGKRVIVDPREVFGTHGPFYQTSQSALSWLNEKVGAYTPAPPEDSPFWNAPVKPLIASGACFVTPAWQQAYAGQFQSGMVNIRSFYQTPQFFTSGSLSCTIKSGVV